MPRRRSLIRSESTWHASTLRPISVLGSVLHRTVTTTMTSADFCSLIHDVTTKDAVGIFRPPVEQISPVKNVIFHYTTAAFTVSREPRASSCVADLPRDSALYAVSVRRLIALRSGFLQTNSREVALAFG
jgi:hypothetical protein